VRNRLPLIPKISLFRDEPGRCRKPLARKPSWNKIQFALKAAVLWHASRANAIPKLSSLRIEDLSPPADGAATAPARRVHPRVQGRASNRVHHPQRLKTDCP